MYREIFFTNFLGRFWTGKLESFVYESFDPGTQKYAFVLHTTASRGVLMDIIHCWRVIRIPHRVHMKWVENLY